jgi:hypothetical protein
VVTGSKFELCAYVASSVFPDLFHSVQWFIYTAFHQTVGLELKL